MKADEWDKIAGDYFNNVSSPFEKGVQNPLLKIVGRIKKKKQMNAIDLGTGIGNLVPFLEQKFSRVVAVDFSKEMIKRAKNKSKSEKTEFIVKDMRDLKGLYGKFDIAFAINSMIMPSVNDVKKIMGEARKVLKKNGRLVAVFPSLESVLYKAMLTYDYELGRNRDIRKARLKTYKRIEKNKYNFVLGFMNEEGEQKHFYKFEIEYRLKKAGFKNIFFEKVQYPWRIWEEKYFLKFKNQPKMWDWLVTAEKK